MIRPARPDDTPELKRLTAGTGVFKPHEIDVLQEVLDEFHAGNTGPDHTAVVLEEHGRILGYVYYAPDVMTDGSWYIYWIAVDHHTRGKGTGSRLMQYVEDDVRKRKGRLMF